jgi:hypothetical protein
LALEYVIEKSREKLDRLLYFGPGMNVPLYTCRYAIYPALAIQGDPGVPDLSDFIEVCCRFMKAFCKTGIGPNGFPEEDIGYGTACISYVIEIGEMLLRSGHMNLFKHPNLRAFGQALLHFVQPWGEALSITGDIGNGWTYDHVPLARIAHETNDPTLIWLTDSTANPSYGERAKLKNGRQVLGRYCRSEGKVLGFAPPASTTPWVWSYRSGKNKLHVPWSATEILLYNIGVEPSFVS